MIDSAKLSDVAYWLNPGPGDLSEPYLYFFVTVFGFCVVLKLLLRFMGRQYIDGWHKARQRVVYRIEALFLTMGILGLLWTFFRFELVPHFSARYWLAVWLLGFIIWGYVIYHYARFDLPLIEGHDRARDHRKKYFSKKKR